MKLMFLLAAALVSVAALTACRSAVPGPHVSRQEIPAGSTTVRAGMLNAKRQQQEQQQPLTNFETRCRQISDAIRCKTN